MTERFGLRIREVATSLGIGLTLARQLVARGEIRSVRIGKRLIVTPDAIASFLAKKEGEK